MDYDTYAITVAEECDCHEIAMLDCECLSEAWSENDYKKVICQNSGVIFCARNTEIITAVDNNSVTEIPKGTLCGFASMMTVLPQLDEKNDIIYFGMGDIGNIAVKKVLRHRGIGNMLLKELIAYAKKLYLSPVVLEVRQSNAPAIAMYEKNGFLQSGERKNYYRNPSENAVLMNLQLF